MGNSIDPTTGKILFDNTPHTVADLQTLGDAVYGLDGQSVPTYGDLSSIVNPRAGMVRWVVADGCAYRYDGSTWSSTQQTIALTTSGGSLGSGFTSGTGANAVRITRESKKRTLYGTAVYGSGSSYSSVLTLAATDRPTTGTARSLGLVMVQPSSGNALIAEAILTNGVLSLGPATGSLPVGTVHLTGVTWTMD